MGPKVYNKYHKNAPSDAVYIGRGSMFGNSWSHLDGTKAQFKAPTRDAACDAFEEWARSTPDFLSHVKQYLRGKDLVCFCKPARCHGDFLLKIANE